LKFAGPIINSVGWPLVTLFTLCVAASMAELASAYPTAGGLYYWAYRLGGTRWAWVTAWFNMIGQITITAGIDIAAAIYIVGFLSNLLGIPPDAPVPVFGTVSSWGFYVFVMVLIMIPQVLINIFGIRLTALLSDFSVYWHIAGVFIIAGLLTFLGKVHQPLSFLFSFVNTVNPLDASSAPLPDGTVGPALVIGPWTFPSPLFALIPALKEIYRAAPFLLVFALGLLQAQWTYTGYDASAHMAEETIMARLNSAWGVFLSVAVSGVVGYIVLMALTAAIPDIPGTVNDPYPVLYIVRQNLAPFFANLIGLIIAGAMWLCGLSSITSMSRMWFAFARDGGMPGYSLIRRIHPRLRTPVWSILITSMLAVLLTIYSAAYYVVTAISTITLYLAYGLPTYLNLRNKLRKRGEYTTPQNAPWNLGALGPWINGIAIAWIAFITILFCLPPNELTLWTILGLGVVMVLYWQLDAKRRFTGPTPLSEEELRRIEAELEAMARGRPAYQQGGE